MDFQVLKKYLDEDTNTFEAKRKVGSKIVWHFWGWIQLNVARLFKLFHSMYSWKFKEDHNDKDCNWCKCTVNVQ